MPAHPYAVAKATRALCTEAPDAAASGAWMAATVLLEGRDAVWERVTIPCGRAARAAAMRASSRGLGHARKWWGPLQLKHSTGGEPAGREVADAVAEDGVGRGEVEDAARAGSDSPAACGCGGMLAKEAHLAKESY